MKQRHYRVRDQYRVSEDTDEVDTNRCKRTLMPNFIHSLDAAAMIATVNRCDFPVSPVHDCFGAFAPHMRELHRAVRDTYCELFSKNLLRDFAVQLHIDTNALPDIGLFTPETVKRSGYCFT